VEAVNRLITFFRESRAELKKVEWPAKPEVINSTIVVAVSLLVVSLMLGGMDLFLTLIIRLFVGM
jgi:preprotein translocase subunit SecE